MECEKCRKVPYETHECPEEMVLCLNDCESPGTGRIQKIKRKALHDHVKYDCPKTILDCPFKDQGCSVQVERQHMDQHVQDNMAAHMTLLARQCSTLVKQNSSLVEQNTKLTEQCSTLANKCSSLTEECSSLTEEWSLLAGLCSLLAEQDKTLTRECSELKESLLSLTEETRLLKDEVKKNDELSRTYSWKISEYRDFHRDRTAITSPTFWLCGHSWYLELCPGNSVKVRLCLEEVADRNHPDVTIIRSDTDIPVSCRLTVKSQRGTFEDDSFEKYHVFNSSSGGWNSALEWEMARDDVLLLSGADDSLIINCMIQVDEKRKNEHLGALLTKYLLLLTKKTLKFLFRVFVFVVSKFFNFIIVVIVVA